MVEKMKYIIYTKSKCPYCVKAIKFLNEKKLFHKKVSLDDNETVHEEIKEAFSWPTVPFILVTADDENFRKVGGYTDLIDLFSEDPETTDSLED